MKNIVATYILFGIFSSCQKNVDNKFSVLSDFNQSKNQYAVDTIELENVSGEGGELISYHNDSGQLVLDFFIYGETGKLNYTFFTNKKLEYHFAVKKNYQYNRPIYEHDLKIDSTINYVKNSPLPKLFDQNGLEIQDKKMRDSLITEMDVFLKSTMKNNVVLRK